MDNNTTNDEKKVNKTENEKVEQEIKETEEVLASQEANNVHAFSQSEQQHPPQQQINFFIVTEEEKLINELTQLEQELVIRDCVLGHFEMEDSQGTYLYNQFIGEFIGADHRFNSKFGRQALKQAIKDKKEEIKRKTKRAKLARVREITKQQDRELVISGGSNSTPKVKGHLRLVTPMEETL